ncbi:MAG: hypothetical protein WAK63_06140 [Xanthobacteraceae bacterium]
MSGETKRYVIAQKLQLSDQPPAPLHEMLNAVNGVEVIGVQPKRAQINATSEALTELRSRIGDWFHIEESAERDLP